jgi:hypothetical protein
MLVGIRRNRVENRDSVNPVLSVKKVVRQGLVYFKYKGR